MHKILISAFRCNPTDVSEAYSAVQWIRQASGAMEVCVATPSTNKNDMENLNLKNTTYCFIDVKNLFEASTLITKSIKLDYFIFNHKLKQIPAGSIRAYDLAHHLTPMGIRYPCALSKKSVKFMIGPIGGGVPTPAGFKEIFKREPAAFQMRKIDKLRFHVDFGLRETYERSRKILIVGDYVKELIPDKWHAKCEVMSETGIVASRFLPIESSGENKETIKLLFVGRIVPTKGLELLLVAMAQLTGKYPLHLDVIGDGEDRAYCMALADKLGISRYVDFLGFLPKETIIRYYQECDMFVFPSLREASGNVIFEAMSCAKPLIVSDSGGPGQVVKASFGIKIKPENYHQYINELINAIESLIISPEKRKQMGQNARKEILETYDWEAKGKKIKAIYEDLIIDT